MLGTCISLFIPHNHQLLKDSWDLNLGLISSEAKTLHIILPLSAIKKKTSLAGFPLLFFSPSQGSKENESKL